MRRNIVILIFLASICTCNGQDSIKQNYIAITPTSMLDMNLSISYRMVINEFLEFTINPRLKLSYHDPSVENGLMVFDQYKTWPWAYHRIMMRSGFFLHYKEFFIEPLVQYDFGFKNNKWSFYDGSPEFMSILADRHYHSIGVIAHIGIFKRKGDFYFKYFAGFGYHYRFYNVVRLQEYGIVNDDLPYVWKSEDFGKSIHLGLEIGKYF